MRALVARFGWSGFAAWLLWSAFDGAALWPAFRLLPAIYRAAFHHHH